MLLGNTFQNVKIEATWMTYVMIAVYFLILLGIGYYAYKQSTSTLDEYMLGGRSLGPLVTALSAGAADMSGWMLMGLPGSVYSTGLSATWIAIGLTVGAWLNYILVASRLRVYTELADNAITIPDFFEKRVSDHTRVLKIISGLVIIVFFTLYTQAGMVSGGVLFESAFGLDYHLGLILTAGIVIIYTLFGGYLAVSLTDFFQGVIMLIALVLVPIVAMLKLNGLDTLNDVASLQPTNLDWFKGTTTIGIISLLAWGLGYFGQPHIIVRFMSIRTHKLLPAARRIGISWMAVSLVGACMTGLVGISFVHESGQPLDNPETIFVVMSQILFHPLIAGFFLAAILAAIMSTISSQLLVTSSSLTQDFYMLLRKTNIQDTSREKEFVLVGRLSVLLVAVIAGAIAWSPNDTILNLVGNAWAGFGAAFGPLVLLSLYWKGLTKEGAITGMILGSITVIFWIIMKAPEEHAAIFDLYEIIPGFLISLISTVLISMITKKPDRRILDEFDEMVYIVKN
ncbi:sodium/proline symporter PutP [Macrococcus hajekii]|uniref:Sodium/proline symporter n=1 Tax=Macrococcus hajekii TaxID=198482 RepID=A0A4V3BDU8_9STAP|nr:sodium/proline symporter PutP [Macrococcus hajekii]TDM01314.1 sodium/proline symporter PutP [Macrococcus hajekii]GGB10614.1 sodium/proline symporter [Macrococcus hajekii]